MTVSLAKTATLGAAWSITTSLLSRAIGLIGTLLLVRYIAPVEYGEVSAAYVLVSTAQQFSSLGVGLYLVTNPTAGPPVVFHATFIHLVLGAIAIGLVVAFRAPLGPLFDAPGLVLFVPGLALSAFIDRVGQVPEKLLARQLRFRTLSLSRGVGDIAYTGISLGLAARGFGGMSVVIGNVARSILRSGVMVGSVSWREWLVPYRLDRAVARKMLGFGLAISLGAFALFAGRRWDNLVIASLFGPTALGLYNLAYNLADVPATQVGEQVSDVLVASFPRLEPEKRYGALLRAVRILAVIIFPMAIGLGAVSPTLSEAFLNKNWTGVGPILLVLSALSIPRPICGALFAYMQSRQRAWGWTAIEWVSVIVMLSLMALLGKLGLLWAAAAVGIGFTFRYVLFLLVLRKSEGMPAWPFVREVLPPLAASAVMGAGVWMLAVLLRSLGVGGPLVRLGIEVVAGGILYVAASLVIARSASHEILSLSRKFLGRGGKTAVPVAGP